MLDKPLIKLKSERIELVASGNVASWFNQCGRSNVSSLHIVCLLATTAIRESFGSYAISILIWLPWFMFSILTNYVYRYILISSERYLSIDLRKNQSCTILVKGN